MYPESIFIILFFTVIGVIIIAMFKYIATQIQPLLNKYETTKDSKSIRWFQDGTINDTCFNGTLAFGCSDQGFKLVIPTLSFRKHKYVLIPYPDITITSETKYLKRYKIIQIKGFPSLRIGLTKDWTRRIEHYKSQEIPTSAST